MNFFDYCCINSYEIIANYDNFYRTGTRVFYFASRPIRKYFYLYDIYRNTFVTFVSVLYYFITFIRVLVTNQNQNGLP